MSAAIRWAAETNTGLVRPLNEDSAYAGCWLFAVADGMGGHAAGEVASATAIQTLVEYDKETPAKQLIEILGTAIREANAAIHRSAEDNPGRRGMGTTLTATLWAGSMFALAHIGDSRAYRLRGGQLRQLTEDHALHNLVSGANTSEILAPIMSRYLDGRPDRSPDLGLRETQSGDRYLLCSDGLSGIVSDARMREVLESAGSPSSVVEQLISLAISLGGPDNITAILIDVVPEQQGTGLAPVLLGAAAGR